MQEQVERTGDRPRPQLASSLETAWPLPHDTYVTDGFPELLTRLSLVSAHVAKAKKD